LDEKKDKKKYDEEEYFLLDQSKKLKEKSKLYDFFLGKSNIFSIIALKLT